METELKWLPPLQLIHIHTWMCVYIDMLSSFFNQRTLIIHVLYIAMCVQCHLWPYKLRTYVITSTCDCCWLQQCWFELMLDLHKALTVKLLPFDIYCTGGGGGGTPGGGGGAGVWPSHGMYRGICWTIEPSLHVRMYVRNTVMQQQSHTVISLTCTLNLNCTFSDLQLNRLIG